MTIKPSALRRISAGTALAGSFCTVSTSNTLPDYSAKLRESRTKWKNLALSPPRPTLDLSSYTITLPAQVSETPPLAETRLLQKPAAPPASDAAPIVLVIDDDEAVRDLMQRSFGKDGYRVEVAADGRSGLEMARRLKPAVITLDVMMPSMDGWAVLNDLKADPATAGIPVVMLTMVDEKNMGFALGAADYFTKPIDWQRLSAVLKKHRRPAAAQTVLVV